MSIFTVPVPVIETKRLSLRELRQADAADTFAYCSNPLSAKYALWHPHTDIAETRMYISWQKKMWRRGGFVLWAIAAKSTGKVIGTCSLTKDSGQTGIAELGYGILSEWWGNGYCTEAVSAVLEYAFSELGAVRIYARMLTENTASARLACRVGMQYEGTLKKAIICKGKPRDLAVYALTDDSYKKLKNGSIANMQKIESFKIDHTILNPGIYTSRVDGDITTYDIRFKKPNAGDYIETAAAHTVEHLFATFVRNSEFRDEIIYFGPMGCRTGFYFLVRRVSPENVIKLITDALKFIAEYSGEIMGATEVECGNYREHDLAGATTLAKKMLSDIENYTVEMLEYPVAEK